MQGHGGFERGIDVEGGVSGETLRDPWGFLYIASGWVLTSLPLYIMAGVCTVCYEVLCPHGANPATPCFSIPGAANTFKIGAMYTGVFKSALPSGARTLDAGHLDHLSGQGNSPALARPMSAEHAVLHGLLVGNTLPIAELHNTIYFLTLHPENFEDVVRNGGRLMASATAAQQTIVNSALRAASEARTVLGSQAVVPSTAAAYKQAQSPRAQLLHHLIKTTENGERVDENPSVMFDPASGKAITPFEKMTKATTAARLMYAISSFCRTMCIVKGEAPTVYYRFEREIMRVADTHGVYMAQKLGDNMLRMVDDGTYDNIVALFNQGAHNRLLSEMLQERNVPVGDAAQTVKDTKKSGDQVDSRKRMVFGAVKQPLGGPGAGIITHFRTGAKLKCNKFHATPQEACTAGVPVGHPGVPKSAYGTCAYEH